MNLPGDFAVLSMLLAWNDAEEPLVVEVGVDKARTSAQLLETFPRLRLVGVDPYPGIYAGVPSSKRYDGMGAAEIYEIAAAEYALYGERAKLHRMPSLTAASKWTGG